MSYVDAVFDRDQDIIKVVERVDGKRKFHEYPVKYTFYYKDQKGKHKSIYGDPLTRIVSKNTKDFRKEVAINKDKKMLIGTLKIVTFIFFSNLSFFSISNFEIPYLFRVEGFSFSFISLS